MRYGHRPPPPSTTTRVSEHAQEDEAGLCPRYFASGWAASPGGTVGIGADQAGRLVPRIKSPRSRFGKPTLPLTPSEAARPRTGRLRPRVASPVVLVVHDADQGKGAAGRVPDAAATAVPGRMG